MFWWLVGVIACLLVWGSLWKRNFGLAFGILIGVLLAWLLSYFIRPYITGEATVPVWLPPLPLATVAVSLFIYGVVVWVRGNDALPEPKFGENEHRH
jgi:uncharacterized membrane protein YccC